MRNERAAYQALQVAAQQRAAPFAFRCTLAKPGARPVVFTVHAKSSDNASDICESLLEPGESLTIERI